MTAMKRVCFGLAFAFFALAWAFNLFAEADLRSVIGLAIAGAMWLTVALGEPWA